MYSMALELLHLQNILDGVPEDAHFGQMTMNIRTTKEGLD